MITYPIPAITYIPGLYAKNKLHRINRIISTWDYPGLRPAIYQPAFN